MAADVQLAQQSPESATAAAAPATAAPSQPTPSQAGTTATPASSASQSANSDAAAATQTAPGNDGASSKQVKVQMMAVPSTFKRPAGYQTVTRGSTTLYCKTSKTTGSNIPQTTCLTEQQVVELQRQEEQARREIAQKSSTCVGACGGG